MSYKFYFENNPSFFSHEGQGNPCGELETIARDCYRAFDGTNQETRRDIAKLLGTLVAYTQQVKLCTLLLV